MGSTREEAVEVCGVAQEYAMLRLLRCRDHTVPAVRRHGNVGERTPLLPTEPLPPVEVMMSGAPLPPGARDHHVVDVFEIRCAGEAPQRVYTDLYHCAGPR